MIPFMALKISQLAAEGLGPPIDRRRLQRFELILREEMFGDLQRGEILTHVFNVYADTPPSRDRIQGHVVGVRQIEAQ
jgi:hypothetical protein